MVNPRMRLEAASGARYIGGVAGFLQRIAEGAAALVEHYARERRVAHDIRFLSSLDDRALADIGLTRPEIEDAVRRRADATRKARPVLDRSADALLPLPSIYDGRLERLTTTPSRATSVCVDSSLDGLHRKREGGRVRREAVTRAAAAALSAGRRPPRPARSADRVASS